MDDSQVSSAELVVVGELRPDAYCASTSNTSGCRSIRQFIGGATDVILWKRRRISFGAIIVASIAWLVFEKSGLPFLVICSDVLLMVIVLFFLRANYTAMRNGELEELPELALSEEMVNSTAASFRVRINEILLMAHDITLGKDFRLFFVVVVFLWLLSVIGSLVSFYTLAYIGTIISITVPALYSKYKERIDQFGGFISHKFSQHYRIVDESVISRLPQTIPKDKDD